MHIDWPTLGTWLLATLGVRVIFPVVLKVTRWETSPSCIGTFVGLAGLWTLATGLLRSLTPWNIAWCWGAGIVLVYFFCRATTALMMPLVSFLEWLNLRGNPDE